jgi:hypothetical protein
MNAGGVLGVMAVLLGVTSDCSSTKSNAPSTGSTASKAETLLTAPTSALVTSAQADHQPTSDEIALLSIFWVSFIHAQQTGTIPDLWIQTDLLSLVAGMAAEYPDFFSVGADGGAITPMSGRFRVQGTQGAPSGGCDDTCLPASPIKFLAGIGSDVASAIAPLNLKSIATTVAAVSELNALSSAGGAGSSVYGWASITSQSDANTVIQSLGNLIISTAGVVALGTTAAPTVAVVAGIWAAVKITVNVSNAVSYYRNCQGWQADNCRVDAATDAGCPSGQTSCNGTCTNTDLDLNNCGSCGNECPNANPCVGGLCHSPDGGMDAGATWTCVASENACECYPKGSSLSGPLAACPATIPDAGGPWACCASVAVVADPYLGFCTCIANLGGTSCDEFATKSFVLGYSSTGAVVSSCPP